jgi:hypothetical protein
MAINVGIKESSGRGLREDRVVFSEAFEFRPRKDVAFSRTINPSEGVQTIRIANRERPENVCIKDREQRCIKAETKRNRSHYGGDERRAAAETFQSVTDVLKYGLDQLGATDSAAVLFRLLDPAEPNTGQTGCLGVLQSCRRVLSCFHLQMELHFLIKFLFNTFS